MSGIKSIRRVLAYLGKTADSVQLPQGAKHFIPSGKKLMHIGLVTHIPDQFVLRKFEEQMKRHRQFHRSQI